MLADIVVDTNVFLHAEDQRQASCTQARELIRLLRTCATSLCLDEGFDLDEARNRSQIGSEYLKHLRFGTAGFALVDHLAKSGRLRLLPRSVPQQVAKVINRHVGKGPDRVYVRIAYNSQEKFLASHDFDDIPDGARNKLLNTLHIRVVAVDAAVVSL